MSNQEAIALLRNLEDSLDSYCGLSEEGKTAFRMAIEALSSSEFPNSSDTDTISRQAAIEVVQNRHMMLNKEKVLLINDLEKLPSAQPEIIRCKDCEHWETQVKGVKGDGLGCCNFHKANFVTGEGFCYWAERREE